MACQGGSLMGSLASGTSLSESLQVRARVSMYESDVDAFLDGFERQTDLVRRLDGFVRALEVAAGG
jgi:hypothetical protein